MIKYQINHKIKFQNSKLHIWNLNNYKIGIYLIFVF